MKRVHLKFKNGDRSDGSEVCELISKIFYDQTEDNNIVVNDFEIIIQNLPKKKK